jgi:C-methyltransferase C-terminal domain/Putative zinc binding domain/Methyltransferase domain
MLCRHCKNPLSHKFLDLGYAPPSNAYLSEEDLQKPELSFPLKLYVCDNCWLVQTQDFANADELFTKDYAYFSSTSTSWLAHAEHYCQSITARLNLTAQSHVVELASNDGYLLKNFVKAGIPCLGIEPTASTAAAARKLGVTTLEEFFGVGLAQSLKAQGKEADLILGNNVYAHVPDINDFTKGIQTLLKSQGVVTLEFPHLLELIKHVQFDTVYHEHYSYLSLSTVQKIFEKAGLRVWHVEKLTTHGGSLRVYGCNIDAAYECTRAVEDLLSEEHAFGMQKLDIYDSFQLKADAVKNNALAFLLEQKRLGKIVVAYGAAAKGNTLLNYAGIKPDLLPFVCDAAEAKQGKYMPGSHIPILAPGCLNTFSPDYLWILPWNIAEEVRQKNAHLKKRGTQFLTVVPHLEIGK